MRRLAVPMTFALALVSCADDEPGETARDAGSADARDGGTPRDGGGLPDGESPPVRRLVEEELLPGAEDSNQLNAPDFDSKLFSAGWTAFDFDPNATMAPPIARTISVDTPSVRRESVRIPGTDTHPGTVAIYGMGWLTGVGFTASVWLGFDVAVGDAPFRGDEVTYFVYEVDAGAVSVDLEEDPSSAITIDGVRWVRFGVTATGRYVGRAMVGIQNYTSAPMWVNGPSLRSVTPFTGGTRPRAITTDERRQLARLRDSAPPRPRVTDLERIGLAPALSRPGSPD